MGSASFSRITLVREKEAELVNVPELQYFEEVCQEQSSIASSIRQGVSSDITTGTHCCWAAVLP